jgi:FkbM family methyltransferase
MAEMENHLGFWWPAGSRDEIRHLVADHAPDAQVAVDFTKQQRVVVQAGGNVGCWPKWLAARFAEVHTFEPEVNNFTALVRNVPETNVIKHFAALGDHHGRVGLRLSPKNLGAHRVEGEGNVPMMMVDDLKLTVCDLLILDIEGHELPALRGAAKTLARCGPVVMVEDRALGRKDERIDAITRWLAVRGYRQVARVHWDVVFTR